jgi:hypothetical protein
MMRRTSRVRDERAAAVEEEMMTMKRARHWISNARIAMMLTPREEFLPL